VFLKKEYVFWLILSCFLLITSRNVYAQSVEFQEYSVEFYSENEKHPYDYKLWEKTGKFSQKVNEVGFKILNANNFPHRARFFIAKKRILNAEARYIDGTIIIYSGMLYYIDNDDELAAVLAHEIAHVKQLSEGNWLWKRIKMNQAPKYYEYDADLTGLDLMAKAGYNPVAMITFYNKALSESSDFYKFILYMIDMSNLFILPIDTHPKVSSRILKIYNHIQTHYPEYLTKDENNIYYTNFLINSEKNQDIEEIKKKHKL